MISQRASDNLMHKTCTERMGVMELIRLNWEGEMLIEYGYRADELVIVVNNQTWEKTVLPRRCIEEVVPENN